MCTVANRAIFLDLQRNRYFALSSKLDRAFHQYRSDRPNGGSCPKSIRELERAGVLDARPPASLPAVQIPDLFSDGAIEEAADRNACASFLLVFETAVAQLITIAALRLIPFAKLMALLSRRPDVVKRCETERAIPAAVFAAFRKTEFIFKVDKGCLRRALAFAWLCRRRHYYPHLVIGVRLNPFCAHAWVQDGDRVLNDAPETVRLYQPILVV